MAVTSIYPYEPSPVLPIVFAAIVFALAVALFIQSYRYKWHHFNFMMTWGSAVWLGGFIARALSVHKQTNVPLFIVQYLLIFIGPPIFAAAEYFILGRLLAYLPYHSPIHPGRVLSTFLFLGAIVEALAASGAATSASPNASESSRESALMRVKASLILQEVVELCFVGMVAMVEYKCRKARVLPQNVKTMCHVLYITSLMVMVRCAVRTVEGFESGSCDPSKPGYNGYCGEVQTKEWYLWVFEVANITVFVIVLAIFHPGRYIPANKNQYLDPDGKVERIGPGFSKASNRSFLMTVIDPFNFAGMAKGQSVDPFWLKDNIIAEKTFATYKSG